MSYNKKAFADCLKKFEQKRENSRLELEQRRQKAYSQIPQLIEIDKKLRELSLNAIKTVFEKSNTSFKEYKKKSLDLRAQKIELLVTAGFPMDYLEEKYDCKKCLDKGFIKSSMCDCFKKELKKECYMKTKLARTLTEQTFKNFDLNFYPNTTNGDSKNSSRESMRKVFNKCKEYADNFSLNSEHLLFHGNVGLGKTFLSSCIAKAVIDKGFYVIYDSAQTILSRFENEHFGKSSDDDTSEYFDCELLIIDDLGAEFKTQFSEAALYNLINSRIISKRPMIISSNLDKDEFGAFYHPRLVSRLLGEFQLIEFSGKDIRNIRKRKQV